MVSNDTDNTDTTGASDSCPCGIGSYSSHCGEVHRNGAGLGVSAEALMRARYSAYVRADREFLMQSWHPNTRPPALSFDPNVAWHGLEVVAVHGGGMLESEGIVEFKARFSRGSENLELHERSSFVREEGRWFYLSGD